MVAPHRGRAAALSGGTDAGARPGGTNGAQVGPAQRAGACSRGPWTSEPGDQSG